MSAPVAPHLALHWRWGGHREYLEEEWHAILQRRLDSQLMEGRRFRGRKGPRRWLLPLTRARRLADVRVLRASDGKALGVGRLSCGLLGGSLRYACVLSLKTGAPQVVFGVREHVAIILSQGRGCAAVEGCDPYEE